MTQTDIRLGTDGTVVVDANYLKLSGPAEVALELHGQQARQSAASPTTDASRRALAHVGGDHLVVNYNGDFTGGVTINGGNGNVTVHVATDRKFEVNSPAVDLRGPVVIHGAKLTLSYTDKQAVSSRPRFVDNDNFRDPGMFVNEQVEIDVLKEILSLRKRLDAAEAQIAELRR